MPQFQSFDADDRIIETAKVTTGYFSDGTGTLAGSSMITASLTASQDKYYTNVQISGGTVDQFSITYGSRTGAGSGDVTGHTKAIYQYYADLLLFPNEIETVGFQFVSGTIENNIWVLSAERARMKDRMNRKNWTLVMGGTSGSSVAGAAVLSLTDDSDSVTATPTPCGPRYNIVSGALGTVHTAATSKTYGWFYPNIGVCVFSGTLLSASIAGGHITSGSKVGDSTTLGFQVNTATDGTAYNHLKLFNCLADSGSFTARSEEDQITTSYFVRVKAAHFNFSNNPTFYSGSDATFSIKEFTGNPQTAITTIGLHDAQGTCVAVGRLSTPVIKNFTTEFTAKVNLVH